MIQLAYTSVAAQTLGSGDIFKIIERSAQNNGPAQLTGFLIYSNRRFFQVIEGPFSGVDELIRRLKGDQRHHSIKIVHHSSVINRSFPNWRMKRILMPDSMGDLDTLVPELADAPEKIKRAADRFLYPAIA